MKIKLLIIITILSIFVISCNDAGKTTEPKSPLNIVKQFPLVGEPLDIDFGNSRLYVAEDQGGFSIHNKNNGELLIRKHNYDSVHLLNIEELLIAKDESFFLLYKTYGTDGFTTFHINENDSISLIGDEIGETGSIKEMYLDYNDTGFFENWEYVMYSITSTRILIGFIQDGNYIIPDETRLYIKTPGLKNFDYDSENYYMAYSEFGVAIFNRFNIGNEVDVNNAISLTDTPGRALDIVKNGNYLYVADRHAGLQVIDITDINNPDLLEESAYDLSYGYATNVSVEGDLLAIAAGGGGCLVFDVSDKSKPELIGTMGTNEVGYVNKVEVNEGYVYVASRENGILKVEVD